MKQLYATLNDRQRKKLIKRLTPVILLLALILYFIYHFRCFFPNQASVEQALSEISLSRNNLSEEDYVKTISLRSQLNFKDMILTEADDISHEKWFNNRFKLNGTSMRYDPICYYFPKQDLCFYYHNKSNKDIYTIRYKDISYSKVYDYEKLVFNGGVFAGNDLATFRKDGTLHFYLQRFYKFAHLLVDEKIRKVDARKKREAKEKQNKWDELRNS